MKCSEDPPNKLNILMAFIEFQKGGLQFDEYLAGLFLKGLFVFVGDADIGWQFAVLAHFGPIGKV
jgi:hypothetical protein